jgi:hypothetical protein
MKFPFKLKEIIIFLFSLAVLILVLNIAVSKVLLHKRNQSDLAGLNSEAIKIKFISALHNFGIKEDWIAEAKDRVNRKDSLKYFFKINVPKDIPISLLIKEINNSFEPGEIIYYSKETKINGVTNLFLISGGFEKLSAEFAYNAEIRRTSCSIGFLIYGINLLNPSVMNQLISTPEPFTIVLLPSKQSLELTKQIKANEKDYAVLLNTDINDLDYKLSSAYSPERLKMSIRSILGDFSNSIAYVYNGKSDFTSGLKFSFIKQEFEKRKVNFIDLNKFNLIDQKGIPLDIAFDSIVNKALDKKNEFIFISADHYLKIMPQISKYRKIGYKFINNSLFLNEFLKSP